MNTRIIHQIIAGIVFCVSLMQFLITAQPTVSFWDPGELSAAAYGLQVPHPPGGPLFSLVGRILYMLPIPGDIGYRMNLLSVFSSAFSVLFLYLIAVRLIGIYKGRKPQSTIDTYGTYVSAAIGALALSFCDTFWFNGSESNYFAASTLLFSSVIWLMLVWYEKSNEPGSWRYFLLIAYITGLAAGVHLMSVLSIFTVVMVIALKRFVDDDILYRKSSYIFIGHIALILLVAIAMWASQTSAQPPSYEEYKSYDSNFKLIIAAISVVIMGLFWKKVFNKNSFYMPVIMGGIALGLAYPGIIKMLPALLRLLADDNSSTGVVVLAAILSLLAYAVYWSRKNKKVVLSVALLAVILAIIGFTTYTMIIIRAGQHLPMNENNPNSFSRLITYLGREQYGDFPMFKRRWSGEPQHQTTWTNYGSDLDFFVRYQMDHMFNRFVGWNFIGRGSRIQDVGIDAKQLFGIPFLVGLLGLYFHFRKDWKMASAFLLLFILMGYLTAFYQNQQESQPRERDYFYAGAYFIFALWIALGIRGFLDLIEQKFSNSSKAVPAYVAVLLIGVLFIPGRMLQTNYFTHDRSKNWLPWDFAYNLLQSCAPNSILVTNGDNDTFPLWYLQDVEGVRRDIRIVNLSLVNVEWYIKQLKYETPYGTPKVKMNLTDNVIDKLQPMRWDAQKITLPVPQKVIAEFGITDTAVINNGSMTFVMQPTLHVGDIGAVRTQDIVLKEIVQQNSWERPIYFAITCGEDTKIGLSDYLQTEGFASRLIPQKRNSDVTGNYNINETALRKNLFGENTPSSTTYQPGFKFRGLNDKNIFFDENDERTLQNYRGPFMMLATYYLSVKHDQKMCINTLERMEQIMPREHISMDYRLLFNVALLYSNAGDAKRFREMAKDVEEQALARINENPGEVGGYYNPYMILTEVYERIGQYAKAAEVLERLLPSYPNDQGLKSAIARYKSMGTQNKDTTKPQ